jgi:hypothetical protein
VYEASLACTNATVVHGSSKASMEIALLFWTCFEFKLEKQLVLQQSQSILPLNCTRALAMPRLYTAYPYGYQRYCARL